MRKSALNLILTLVIIFSSFSYAQLDSVYYEGPSQGSVASGVTVNTIDFTFSQTPGERMDIPHPELVIAEEQYDLNIDDSNLPAYHYVEDINAFNKTNGSNGQTVLLNGWETDRLANFVPPDPDVAVGPNHIVTTVNVDFSIWDKQGNLINNINAETWCGQAIANPGAFDPQIVFDHYEGRWIMLWDARSSSTESSFVISYSDDDDPNGVWYMYAINASMNGSNTTSFWADYPHIGYDEEAIYITSNQFNIGNPSNQYPKIRILIKSELYASNGGPLTWQDIWNIRRPGGGSGGQAQLSMQPAISYSNGDKGYFAWAAWFTNNYYSLFKINNATTTPSLRGRVTFVTSYGEPNNANQLGGGTRLESDGGFNNTLTVRDGFLYAAHAINNSTASGYSSIKYVKIDVSNGSIVEQSEFGASGFYYMYPTITVDKDNNIAATYSRSADTEYAGAYYSTKYNGDTPGLTGSLLLAEGQGNYVVVFSGSRNRWGDYHDIDLDPSNDYDIWIFPEYAAATNVWGTYVGQIRMVPLPGLFSYIDSNPVEFNDTELGTNPTTETVLISNYGEDDWIINNINSPIGPFTLLTTMNYPDTLSTYDSLELEIEFNPDSVAIYSLLMAFDDNDPNFDGLTLNGTAFEINPALKGTLYSSTGVLENGKMLIVDKNSGEGSELGLSNFNKLNSLAIHPDTDIIYGISTSTSETELARVNAAGGDAFTQYTLDIGLLSGIAFDTTGTFYGATRAGDIYAIDLSDGSYNYVITASIEITSIAFDPVTNELWASPRIVFGPTKDRIYKVDLTTGDATLIGETGFDVTTNDLAFDDDGIL
jgi:hypothetical protein